jgi:exodeoxyribonuclease VII small subunit
MVQGAGSGRVHTPFEGGRGDVLGVVTKFIKKNHMSKKEFSFNDAVTEIENILRNIESGDLDIDKLSVEVKRASELIKECQKKLKNTEDEINSIFRELV